ncbi:tRNA dihydrouridine(20/20a) synthase DusA [Lutibaculum baratangense]|uniref:tRNA-dihydrouridine(20/20a) synthase n=1 Tax=Lutibaculum baratangense AMV1 TaxID=631454 RepID=V4RUH2_9HYPH|nr:tRNA dihydrouridine(20/20a) synthase DusA [Lutibaculum baratangense]ESR26725.1 tRNA dihydrouridine synthase A [Lutibaculum baratangense AMV1]
MSTYPHIFSVAPMIDWTDRRCRFFHRQLTRRALLYTEMIVASAILRGDARRLLRHDEVEHPVALQLGGSDPAELAEAARVGAEFGYDEINLNVGCPSDKVQSGRFGACLMAEPDLVGRCVEAMATAVAVPVTVKCRLGIDDQDIEAPLDGFVARVADAGAQAVIVHARKAWLQGLDPKQNREIPPLDYARVHRLKERFPELPIVLNGGLKTLEDALPHLEVLDGVMLGRASYQTPAILGEVDPLFYGEGERRDPVEAIEAMRPFIARELDEGTPLHRVTKHMLGLFQGMRGARRYRQIMSEEARVPGSGLEVLDRALAAVDLAAVSRAA